MATMSRAEEWIPERNEFLCRLPSRPPREFLTFCVPLSTLVEICPDADFDPQQCFAVFRHQLYAAAERKAARGAPAVSMVISAEDIRPSDW